MFQYPYGDTQQLNLDWLMEQWQETKASIDGSLQGEIDRVEAAITDLLTARDQAVAAKTAAETAATSASGYASTASTAASTATAQATAAAGSAALAGTHASNAQASETNAALQATAAGNSASAAATSATNARNSELAAAASALSASNSSSAAAGNALYAEGWAVGKQNGTPVSSGSPYYENNAKYYADAAETAAASIPDISALQQDVLDLQADVGDLNDLQTSDKSNLVAAINEAATTGGGGGGMEYVTIENTPLAHITDGMDSVPLAALELDIHPAQAGVNPPAADNIRPLTGYTQIKINKNNNNLFNGVMTNQRIQNGVITNTGTWRLTGFIPVEPNKRYHILKEDSTNYAYTYLAVFDINKRYLQDVYANPVALMPANAAFIRFSISATSWSNINNKLCVCLRDVTVYANYGQTEYVIDIPAAIGTMYGGNIDVKTGTIEVCPYYASYNGETLVGEWLSDRDVYDPNATPTIGAQVVNLGGSTTQYTFTPLTIATSLGVNNIWTNAGQIKKIIYASSTTIEDKIKIVEAMLAPIENTATASANYSINDFLILGNELYIVTANISAGSTIIESVNVTKTTIGEQITAILNA